MAKKVLIVYAHPNPKSFNHGILETVVETLKGAGIDPVVHDLYAMGFNPCMGPADFTGTPPDVAAEREAVAAAEIIVFISPIWWFSQPAILRGWADRVLGFGFAYNFDPVQKKIVPLLGGKRVFIVNTAGNPASAYENGPRAAVETCIDKGVFGFCGMDVADHVWLHGPGDVTQEQRVAWLAEVKTRLQKLL